MINKLFALIELRAASIESTAKRCMFLWKRKSTAKWKKNIRWGKNRHAIVQRHVKVDLFRPFNNTDIYFLCCSFDMLCCVAFLCISYNFFFCFAWFFRFSIHSYGRWLMDLVATFKLIQLFQSVFFLHYSTSLRYKISERKKNAQNDDQLHVMIRKHHPDKLIKCHLDWTIVGVYKKEDLLKCQSALLIYWNDHLIGWTKIQNLAFSLWKM